MNRFCLSYRKSDAQENGTQQEIDDNLFRDRHVFQQPSILYLPDILCGYGKICSASFFTPAQMYCFFFVDF